MFSGAGQQQVPAYGARRRIVHPAAVVTALLGLIVTVSLSFATFSAHDSNERRLLDQRTREATAVLTASLPSIQTPLGSAAVLAEATNGQDKGAFGRLMQPLVATRQLFVSASIWNVTGASPQLVFTAGKPPKIAAQPTLLASFLARSAKTSTLAVVGLLEGSDPRLGYSYTSAGGPVRFVAYGEAALPRHRTAVVPKNSAFGGLDIAIYLGRRETPGSLLAASTRRLGGFRSRQSIPFGDTSLTLVTSPTGELGGALLAWLPWIVLGVGALATVIVAWSVERLLRRRDQAQDFADANAELAREQRSVAHAIQQSLLPERLPELAGLELAMAYQPGAEGLDIGGDWYDAIPIDDRRLMIVVGDVSGRGLKAAAVMASLRYAWRAFASDDHDPAVVLGKLAAMADYTDGRFATIVCAVVDVVDRTVVLANAGHPPPIVMLGTETRFVETAVGVPIGADRHAVYRTTTETVPAGGTLLAFTDGLFERRGETITEGLERLRRNVAATTGSLDEVLALTMAAQEADRADDDTAILGVRWTR